MKGADQIIIRFWETAHLPLPRSQHFAFTSHLGQNDPKELCHEINPNSNDGNRHQSE